MYIFYSMVTVVLTTSNIRGVLLGADVFNVVHNNRDTKSEQGRDPPSRRVRGASFYYAPPRGVHNNTPRRTES